MMMIVCGHMVSQGLIPNYSSGYNLPISIALISSSSRLAVSIFLLIGTYFMVDATFKASRVLTLYGQLAFWIVLLSWGGYLIGYTSNRDLFWSFFPFISKSLWFVSDYLALIVLAPFINIIIQRRRIHKLLVIILSLFVCIMPTIYIFTDSWLDGISFFIYIYILMAYYKRYMIHRFKPNKYILLIGAFVMYVLLVLANQYLKGKGINCNGNNIASKMNQFLMDYKTLPNLFIALSIFYFFQNTHLGKIKAINIMASSALGVYIIHQTPAFYPVLWSKIVKCQDWYHSSHLFGYVILAVVCVYFGLSLVSLIYTLFVEKYWTSSKMYHLIEKKLDEVYKCFIDIDYENITHK